MAHQVGQLDFAEGAARLLVGEVDRGEPPFEARHRLQRAPGGGVEAGAQSLGEGELLVVQALGEGVLIVAEALFHLALAGAEGVGQLRHPGVRLRPPAAQRQGDDRGEGDGEDGRQGHGEGLGQLHGRRLTSRTGRHT